MLPDQYLRNEPTENLWGYAKRLRFIAGSIRDLFPNRAPASIRVLEVGCGNGSCIAIPLAKLGFNVTGIDPHLKSIERARELGEGLPNAQFVAGFVEELVVPSFDVVILSEVLEHLTDPGAMLRAARRHTKESGIVIVTVPNGYGEFEIDWWVFRKLHLELVVDLARRVRGPKKAFKNLAPSIASSENQNCPHVQFFTRPRIKRLFTECSLQVVRQASASFLCGPMIVYALGRSHRFVRWNARVADKLPFAMASGWYFVLRLAKLANDIGTCNE